jgi:hypothetical protein
MRFLEERLQRGVVELLSFYERRRELCFCHVPNGGRRGKVEAAIFIGLGVKRGVPDLIVWTPHGQSFGIELKAGKQPLSDDQVLFHSTLHSLGHRVYVCRCLEDVIVALSTEGVPVIARLAG